MTWTVIIIILVIGVLFLLLEILVVPGTTFIGVVGFALVVLSIVQTYIVYGTPAGHYVLAGAVLLNAGALVLALKSKTWNKMMLKAEVDSKVNLIDTEKVKPGTEGITVSRLSPSGKALFGDEYYEVHSLGGFINPQTPIIVVKVEFSKIIVKPKE